MRYKGLLSVSLIVGIAFCLSGCQGDSEKNRIESKAEQSAENSGKGAQIKKQEITKDSEEIAERCAYIIKQAKERKEADTFKLQQDVIACLGEAGYAAVDIDNQIDMVNYEKAEKFCKEAGAGRAAEVTILLVMDNGSFVRYDLESAKGEVKVLVSSRILEEPESGWDYFEEYTACEWEYTKKGYLFLEQYHMSGFDGAPGQTAIRIKPLDAVCRKLNREYVLPLGYRGNKLLITDWDEQDYTALDFYDLYEVMYMMKYGKDVPYADEYTRSEYEVPEKEFEETIQEYLKADRSLIRENTVYHADNRTYRYRTRGLYDAAEPYEPYPEVTSYEKQEDGSIKLTVEAVWAMKKSDCAMISELVVRPFENGRFQYVSNRVISVLDNLERLWYTPRLTDEEWERLTE